jgi:phage shock protein E
MTKSGGFLIAFTTLAVVALTVTACFPGSISSAPAQGEDLSQQTQAVPVGDGGSYTDVSATGLEAMLEAKDFPLVNVHVPYEREIEGTDLFIPFDKIEQNLDQLPAGKGSRVVLYCRSGSMSAIAARTLVQLGYTDVWNLDGGMIAWEQAGYPLVDEGR